LGHFSNYWGSLFQQPFSTPRNIMAEDYKNHNNYDTISHSFIFATLNIIDSSKFEN
jgi:hypothetical protein